MSLPKKFLLDTNVPKVANLATQPDVDSDVPDLCVLACIEVIEHVVGNGGLVIDADDEILAEYRSQLSLSGQPGVGDRFLKWLYTNIWSLSSDHRVPITSVGDSYREFPDHPGLKNFDKSDRKFVAVANAHPDKPPIFQAADSKWWGWQNALQEAGITVHFVCPDYIESKFKKKIG